MALTLRPTDQQLKMLDEYKSQCLVRPDTPVLATNSKALFYAVEDAIRLRKHLDIARKQLEESDQRAHRFEEILVYLQKTLAQSTP